MPLLFIPRPNISEAISCRSVRAMRASRKPAANRHRRHERKAGEQLLRFSRVVPELHDEADRKNECERRREIRQQAAQHHKGSRSNPLSSSSRTPRPAWKSNDASMAGSREICTQLRGPRKLPASTLRSQSPNLDQKAATPYDAIINQMKCRCMARPRTEVRSLAVIFILHSPFICCFQI